MSKNDGGPAFPRAGFSGPGGFGRPENGMTLRDYFAAKAVQGFCQAEYGERLTAATWAKDAYEVADAMLAERSK